MIKTYLGLIVCGITVDYINSMPSFSTATIAASTLQQQIGTILKRVAVQGEHIMVTRDKFPIVMLLPLADYKMLVSDHERISQVLEEKSNK